MNIKLSFKYLKNGNQTKDSVKHTNYIYIGILLVIIYYEICYYHLINLVFFMVLSSSSEIDMDIYIKSFLFWLYFLSNFHNKYYVFMKRFSYP